MAAKPSERAEAWALFDWIVADAAPEGVHSNPWRRDPVSGERRYVPDFDTLERLLGVPLHMDSRSQSGIRALALDVWLSYELRRAGFDPDSTWPRAEHPRILPKSVANLLAALPAAERKVVADRIEGRSSIRGVTSSSASILGKNYVKQVDVIMTDWLSGPELLISTKRMDSSYGKNAPNRIEESYGDAKNLRLRHPLAALGFLLCLRSDILEKEPDTAEWLIDLMGKLGREDDAYHATCLLMIEYSDALVPDDDGEPADESVLGAGGVEISNSDERPEPSSIGAGLESTLRSLPRVLIREDAIPSHLAPSRFLAEMVERVLDTTPVTFHKNARARRRTAPVGE